MPGLRLLSALGVGFENLAIDSCRRRCIALADGAGTHADCVADHVLALMHALVRAVPADDAATGHLVQREGVAGLLFRECRVAFRREAGENAAPSLILQSSRSFPGCGV